MVALAAADDQAKGATLYTTLEPCSHHGRTPPCTEAIIAAGIKRVVVGVLDPDPAVDGSGVQKLRDAGIEVIVGVAGDEVEEQLAAYLVHRRTGRPLVVLKLAATMDGRIAAPDGSSRWITGPESRRDAHELRRVSDAVLVGAATVRHDDPELTVRTDPVPARPADQGRARQSSRRVASSCRPSSSAANRATCSTSWAGAAYYSFSSRGARTWLLHFTVRESWIDTCSISLRRSSAATTRCRCSPAQAPRRWTSCGAVVWCRWSDSATTSASSWRQAGTSLRKERHEAARRVGIGSRAGIGSRVAFAPIESAVEAISRGEIVIVVDGEDRENEGDLIMAAEAATPAESRSSWPTPRGWCACPSHLRGSTSWSSRSWCRPTPSPREPHSR